METDILKPFIALISNMGFPIAMSIYLLHRMEQRLDTMIHLLTELNHHLKKEWLHTGLMSENITWHETCFLFFTLKSSKLDPH